MKRNTLIAAAAALIVLGVLGAWAYSAHQTRQMQGAARSLVQDTLVRLNEALKDSDPAKLAARLASVQENARNLGTLERSRDRELYGAADEFIGEAGAALRRMIAVQRATDAVRARIAALGGHMSAAGVRSEAWIREALARKRTLDQAYFDYRLAAGGLEKSLQSLRDLGRQPTPLTAAGLVLDDETLLAARRRLDGSSAALGAEVKRTGALAAP